VTEGRQQTRATNALSAETLGQIALIQSMVFNLPDTKSILRFVCRGLAAVPGTAWIGYLHDEGDDPPAIPATASSERLRRFTLRLKDVQYGELLIEISDHRLFEPYLPYIENLCFMLAVIFEERRQRRLNQAYGQELEQRVRERTQQLEREIETRARAEAALKLSEERLRLAMEATQDGLWDWNAQTGQVFWNPRCYTMLGYAPDEFPMSIDKWFELVHPDDRDVVWPKVQRKLEGEGGSFEIEFRYATKQGSWRWIVGRGRPVEWDTQGKVLRVVGTHVDITDRKAAEQAIAESEERLRAIFQTNPDPVVVYDGKGRPKYLNPAFTQVFGWQWEELKDAPIPFVPDDQAEITKAKVREVFDLGKPVKFETQRLTKAGETLDVMISAAAMKYEDGNRSEMVVNLTDITERKRMTRQLQQSQKMEAIGTLTGGIAHDFNNILSIVIGNAEIALDDIQPWHPVHQNLEEIKKASMRAKDVVRQLLGFSRKTEHKRRPTHIQSILEESLQLMRASIPTTIEIRSATVADLRTIAADPTQIHQIIINLCTNAAHAMEKNGGILDVRLSNVHLDRASADLHPPLAPGDYVQLRVRDTGCGIDPKIKDRVFDPYFTTKESGKGSGIGLSVVQGIVRSHEGAISIDSEVEVGTTITVLFPAIDASPVPEQVSQRQMPTGSERILFVDDEQSIVTMGKILLEQLGYRVLATSDPAEALALLKKAPERVDLLITDMTMPKMTGAQLIAQAHSLRPDLATILCTGYSEKSGPNQAAELGIGLYLEKPLRKSDLAEAVRTVLDATDRRSAPAICPAKTSPAL
jgi:two-component system, cell cycle sensor histidine kinase and response regulator CckA